MRTAAQLAKSGTDALTGLRAGLPAITRAALKSALASKAHERQRNLPWLVRFPLAVCLHTLHSRDVLRGSTRTSSTPAIAAL